MIGLDRFQSESGGWGSDDFARWLLAGFDQWLKADISFAERANAFQPLIFFERDNPLVQIAAAISGLSGGMKIAFQDGLRQALNMWTGSLYSLSALRDLLRLCPTARPPNLLPTLRDLLSPGRLDWDGPAQRRLTVDRLATAACVAATESGFSSFFTDLKSTSDWQPGFAARALLASAPHLGRNSIMAIRDDWRDDLDQLFSSPSFNEPRFIKNFARLAGFRNVCVALAALKPDDFDHFIRTNIMYPLFVDPDGIYQWEFQKDGDVIITDGNAVLRLDQLSEVEGPAVAKGLIDTLSEIQQIKNNLHTIRRVQKGTMFSPATKRDEDAVMELDVEVGDLEHSFPDC